MVVCNIFMPQDIGTYDPDYVGDPYASSAKVTVDGFGGVDNTYRFVHCLCLVKTQAIFVLNL